MSDTSFALNLQLLGFRLRHFKRPAAFFSSLGAALVAFNINLGGVDMTPWGFVFMLIGSILGIIVGFWTNDIVVKSQWIFFTILNIIGIWRWF